MNPWQQQGVSILPKKLENLLPMVGQKSLFRELEQFRDNCLKESETGLTGFLLVHGGWGVGKSRVGHELCLEAVSDQVRWIIDGEPKRILDAGLSQGILPLFTRYIQVTTGAHSKDLNAENWIPTVVVESLSRLVSSRHEEQEGSLKRNQDLIVQHTINALKPKGWDFIKPLLAAALQEPDVSKAARDAVNILKDKGIKSLWVIVDEIEDITDVDQDGLRSSERKPIDQGLLTVIPRVIKAEEARQEYPEVNFVLLCSLAVGDMLKQIRAISRRTQRHELRTNAFKDVEAFFVYLANQPRVAELIKNYPAGLKEAAFFASNRNFGWFNVVMHHAHDNFQGGKVPAWELIRRFAETGQGREFVFDNDWIGEFRIKQDEDKSKIEEMMYGLLPKFIDGQLPGEEATRLLAKKDAADKNLFTTVVEVNAPEAHRITTQFIKSGFENERGSVMVLPGESRFDLQVIMESLQAYSAISLGEVGANHLLVCESLPEFTAQLKGLSPYAEQVEQFAGILHGILADPTQLIKNGTDVRRYMAPAFTFLARFHRLNRVRAADEGYLTESKKNAELEEALHALLKDRTRRARKVLQGIANAVEQDQAPVLAEAVLGCQLPSVQFQTNLENFRLGFESSVVILYASQASSEQIEQDLNHLASKRPAEPVLLVLESEENRESELMERLARTVPKMAARIVLLNLTDYLAANLARLGLLGEVFQADDPKTSHFHAAISQAREVLKSKLNYWRAEVLGPQGLVLAPLFYGTKVDDHQLEAFAKGYSAMLGGLSFQDVCQTANSILDEGERDEFRKLVERQLDPNAKFKDEPLLPLVSKPEAEEKPELPRALLAVTQRCSKVAVPISTLERDFFFELPKSREAKIKPLDIIRQLVAILHYMGLVVREGDQINRVSKLVLEKEIQGATDWLENRFEKAASKIKSIHQDEGERLLDARGKEARQGLKEANSQLQGLELDFVTKSWKELNKPSGDDMPVYEQRLRTALGLIGKIKSALGRVYDPQRDRAFSYSPEVLTDFQANQANYPLWKRIKVLEGFYRDLDTRRRDLVARINKVREEVDRRVPALKDGDGTKAFPTQVLSLPLEMYHQELSFDSLRPNKTIAVGGSTVGIASVGYKIFDGKYKEAVDRLNAIEAELTQPGKLVSNFYEHLGQWESMCAEIGKILSAFKAKEAFLTDAPEPIKNEIGIKQLGSELDDLEFQLTGGGIRQSVDVAEAAGAPPAELISRLEVDLQKLSAAPQALLTKLVAIDQRLLPSMEERYQKAYADLTRAHTRICNMQGKEFPLWPSQLGSSYVKTESRFKEHVDMMRKEGEAFFSDVAGTKFDDYVSLLKMQEEGEPIDWHSSALRVHMENLARKKLLELRLV